ncbi:hypothetical protein QNO07_09310 [Streptomyces sp. 549]|uniref:hypothetical protein n=1 Tax=Streptomyces sp. 549 TaxID=3049076 RepID=UPI0024C3D2CB|nr:hypothetical protein [Streptomyces sp. 549]MDK1473616.1 hypothetical protein [Streptomyces sp. 549]
MTAVANTVFAAAQFNQYVRDNLNETAPAKATTAGTHFAGTGVNSIAERVTSGAADLGSGTTTATAFTDLDAPASAGPSVTLTTGPRAILFYHCQLENSGAGSSRMGVEVSGASSIATALNRSIGIFGSAGTTIEVGDAVLYTGGLSLTPGSNTFTAKYRVSSGTGTFSNRRLIVLPF